MNQERLELLDVSNFDSEPVVTFFDIESPKKVAYPGDVHNYTSVGRFITDYLTLSRSQMY